MDLGEGQEVGGKMLGCILDGRWGLAKERYGGWMGTEPLSSSMTAFGVMTRRGDCEKPSVPGTLTGTVSCGV